MSRKTKIVLRVAAGAVAIVCLLVMIYGCNSEDTAVSTHITVAPWIETENGADRLSYSTGVVVYAHYADTLEWTVKNYADARDGVITNRLTGEILDTPVARGTIDMRGELSLGQLTKSPVFLVVYDRQGEGDPSREIYGYRETVALPTLETMRLPVVIKPWETRGSYSESQWWMFNENPPLPQTSVTVEPYLQTTEDATAVAHTSIGDVVLYAFPGADTLTWRVASFEHARDGILTNKQSGETYTGEKVVASPSLDGRLALGSFTESEIMLVICDKNGHDVSSKMYGYAQTSADRTAPARSFRVTFCPWRTEAKYYAGSPAYFWMINDNPPVATP